MWLISSFQVKFVLKKINIQIKIWSSCIKWLFNICKTDTCVFLWYTQHMSLLIPRHELNSWHELQLHLLFPQEFYQSHPCLSTNSVSVFKTRHSIFGYYSSSGRKWKKEEGQKWAPDSTQGYISQKLDKWNLPTQPMYDVDLVSLPRSHCNINGSLIEQCQWLWSHSFMLMP